jgi:hypothetical protein
MKWSQLKKRVEDNLAPTIKGRVQFFTTAYRKPNSSTGRGWITLDGEEVANFSTMDSGRFYGRFYNETTPDNKLRYATHERVADNEREAGNLVERGEFSRFDLHICMFESLSMTATEMVKHESPIVQILGILDRRTGKRSLEKLKGENLSAFPRLFLDYRLSKEGLQPD